MIEGLSEREQKWIEMYVNRTISAEDFALFEKALKESAELRAATRQYLALDANLGRAPSRWPISRELGIRRGRKRSSFSFLAGRRWLRRLQWRFSLESAPIVS
ncbi:MAG: hypothetical protein AAGB46_03855 [Verrucomicrobiota bacterium]